MLKKVIGVTVLLGILVVLGFLGYGAYYDHRKADYLSAYCHIDFRSELDAKTDRVKQTTLSIVDFRYSRSPLEKEFSITIDGKTYEVDTVEVGFSAPVFSWQDDKDEQWGKARNTLLITFPRPILEQIKGAKEIRVAFRYVGSDTAIDLPLSAPDLKYWQDQLAKL